MFEDDIYAPVTAFEKLLGHETHPASSPAVRVTKIVPQERA